MSDMPKRNRDNKGPGPSKRAPPPRAAVVDVDAVQPSSSTRSASLDLTPSPTVDVEGSGNSRSGGPHVREGERQHSDEITQESENPLETLLARLDIDDEFKESIRALSPDSQREVVNDIVRQRQHEEAVSFLGGTDGTNPFAAERFADAGVDGFHGGLFPDGVEADGEADDEAYTSLREETGDPADEQQEGIFMSFGSGDGARMMRVGDTDSDGNLVMQNMLQFFLQQFSNQSAQAGARGQGGQAARGPTDEENEALSQLQNQLRQQLQYIIGDLQQSSAMRAMGIDRDVDDMSYEELLELEERIGSVSQGIKSEGEMGAAYDRIADPPREEHCPICLEALAPAPTAEVSPVKEAGPSATAAGERREVSPSSSVTEARPCAALKVCGHVFHEGCLRPWLQMHRTCPVCKREVV